MHSASIWSVQTVMYSKPMPNRHFPWEPLFFMETAKIVLPQRPAQSFVTTWWSRAPLIFFVVGDHWMTLLCRTRWSCHAHIFCWAQDKFPYTISQKLFHKEFRNFELGRRENFKAYWDLSQNFLNVPAEICGLLWIGFLGMVLLRGITPHLLLCL